MNTIRKNIAKDIFTSPKGGIHVFSLDSVTTPAAVEYEIWYQTPDGEREMEYQFRAEAEADAPKTLEAAMAQYQEQMSAANYLTKLTNDDSGSFSFDYRGREIIIASTLMDDDDDDEELVWYYIIETSTGDRVMDSDAIYPTKREAIEHATFHLDQLI